MHRTIFVCLMFITATAHAARPAESWRSELADEATQSTSAQALDEFAKKAGAQSFGQLVKAIPADDLAAAVGAATSGDASGATQALSKGLVKSLAALGAEAAAGAATSAAAAPLIAAVGAAFLAGALFDTLVSDDQAEAATRMRALELRLQQSKNKAERSKLKFDRDVISIQLELLRGKALTLKQDDNALLVRYAQGQLTRAEYEKAALALRAQYAEVVKSYTEQLGKLATLQPTNQEAKLAQLKARHAELKAIVDASGGHDHAAYVEMKAVYQEYMSLKRDLEKR